MKEMLKQVLPAPLRRAVRALIPQLDGTSKRVLLKFPPGHFYSALPEPREFTDAGLPCFSKALGDVPGIDLREAEQFALLEQLVKECGEFEPPKRAEDRGDGARFHLDQNFFLQADAFSLHSMLRRFTPQRVIEVGSGFSSALMLDTLEEMGHETTKLTFIDPYPDRLKSVLHAREAERVEILEKPVQEIPLETFDALAENDLLFIDSSHVSKIASDVNYLFFEILPRLKPGVIVHVHDIFWKFEYPQEWILQGRAWNEAYLLRAFLQHNDAFEVLLWNSYLGIAQREYLKEHLPLFLENTGGSIYLRKSA